MIVYKVVDENDRTWDGTEWGAGVTHTAPGGEQGVCGPGWLHAYRDVRLAALLCTAHVPFTACRVWEADADVSEDLGDKLLCTRITTIRLIHLPTYTTEQRVDFAIRCARRGCGGGDFDDWARYWIAGLDRSGESARLAARSSSPESPRLRSAKKSSWLTWSATWAAWAAEEASPLGLKRCLAWMEAGSLDITVWAEAEAWVTERVMMWTARAAECAAFQDGCDLISVLGETESANVR